MKKILLLTALFGIVLLVPLVLADQVNMNISVNGTANLNITVDADDTLARAMINETQTDTYGTMTGSSPKDVVLNEIANAGGNPIPETEGLETINQICSDPSLQQYFNEISSLPPLGFVSYLKALGYDDEAHINFIWTMCQQEYINQHQDMWSRDLIGGGVQQGDLVSIFRAAIGWLTGNGDTVYMYAKELAIVLESYFASDKDVWFLANRVKQLELRIEALERTIEGVAPEEYCEVKLDIMEQYNLTGVKCGINSTQYWNAKKIGLDEYETIAYIDCTEDWICVKWSDCENGEQARKCVDKNDCGTFFKKPIESRDCVVSLQQMIEAPFKPATTASKVEEYLTIEQILIQNHIQILLVTFISIATSLIVIGIRIDSKRIIRYRPRGERKLSLFYYYFSKKLSASIQKIKAFIRNNYLAD